MLEPNSNSWIEMKKRYIEKIDANDHATKIDVPAFVKQQIGKDHILESDRNAHLIQAVKNFWRRCRVQCLRARVWCHNLTFKNQIKNHCSTATFAKNLTEWHYPDYLEGRTTEGLTKDWNM